MAAATSPGRAPAGTTATARPGWMGRHPLAAFLLLCFGLTWACLLPLAADSHGWLPFHAPRWLLLPAGWGPGLAAFGVAAATGRRRELLERVTRWRLGLGWYAVALLGPGVLYAAAVALDTLLGGTPPTLPGPGSLLLGMLLTLGLSLLTNSEEIGWRGFVLPRLLEQLSPAEASLVLGVVAAAWRLPFVAWVGGPLASTPLPAFAIFSLAAGAPVARRQHDVAGGAPPCTRRHAAVRGGRRAVRAGGRAAGGQPPRADGWGRARWGRRKISRLTDGGVTT